MLIFFWFPSVFHVFHVFQEYGELNPRVIEPVYTNETHDTVRSKLFKRRHVERQNELQLYLSLPCTTEEINILEWWKMNEQQFSKLARIVCDYLAIPATSVPVEQVFSTSKNLITKRRNRLLSKTIRACMCLKSWWQGPLANND